MNNLEMLELAIEKNGFDKVKEYMFVDSNTINRWKLLKNIPKNYYFDLCNLLEIEIDYSKFSFVEKDQFFTTEDLSKKCLNIMYSKLEELSIDVNDYVFIEPSAGNGSFFKHIKGNKIGFDIEPKIEGIITQNYLKWKPDNNKYIVVGNPPFGLRGNLALRFMNHSSIFSDFICFILPPLFNSSGKGSCMGRVKNTTVADTP